MSPRQSLAFFSVSLLLLSSCSRRSATPSASVPHATAFGSAIVLVSGERQVDSLGATLSQPLVVQVNEAQGNAVTGALVEFRGPVDIVFTPDALLTDSSGQAATNVTLGPTTGRYRLTAATRGSKGELLELKVVEVGLGYQQNLGRVLSDKHCVRCHDSESTAQRVSNFDNLTPPPHNFSDGVTYNKISDADLMNIIGRGGPALGRSAQMPPYGSTLSKAEIQAMVAYIRAVSDPPYRGQ